MKVREAIRESLSLLTPRDRRLLWVAIAIQMSTSLLDLVGVLLLGLVGALAVTTVQSQPAPEIVERLVAVLGLEGLSDQALVGVLAGAAAVTLLIKTATSALLTRRVFIFLANRQALVSAELASKLLARPLTFQQSRSSQEAAYALIQGAGAATLAVLGQAVILATEAAVLIVLAVALFLVDPLVTLVAIGVFALVAIILQRLTGSWASRLGREGAKTDIESLNVVQDALATYREITVLNRREHFVERFQGLRWRAARLTADRTFLLQVPKYVFEVALVVGGGLVAMVLFLTQDSVAAVGILALFLAAASRVMPSLLRLQSASLTLRDNAAAAHQTYELAKVLTRSAPVDAVSNFEDTSERGVAGAPGLELQDVTFRYPNSPKDALSHVSLALARGQSLALVGRSGAGKSTLADLLLGVLDPTSGSVRLGGVPPAQLTRGNPGLVGYVPQEVALIRGTVRDNVALGLDSSEFDEEDLWRALDQAHVAELFRAHDLGLDAEIGERGVKLSGGQRQRLGLARALLSNPRFLVLDEATSALDAETENLISDTIRGLEGDVTVVVIAHRLATVRNTDLMAYMDNGAVVDVGSFKELVQRIPGLARQASLMGITPGVAE